MIYKKCIMTINKNTGKLDEDIYLFRLDKNIELHFTIVNNKYKFDKSDLNNIIAQTNAAYFQIRLYKSDEIKYTFAIQPTQDGVAVLTITNDLIDDPIELGDYDFQISLLDADKTSMISMPIVKQQMHVCEPLVDNQAIMGKAVLGLTNLASGEIKNAFDSEGNYIREIHKDGDILSAQLINKFEEALDTNTKASKDFATKKYVDDNAVNKYSQLNERPIEVFTYTEKLNKVTNVTQKLCTIDVADLKADTTYMCPDNCGRLVLQYTKLNNSKISFYMSYSPNSLIIQTGYKNDKQIEILIHGIVYTVTFKTATEEPKVEQTVRYLTDKNTTEYTPKEDYNPATKKYVDDNKIAYTISSKVLTTVPASDIELDKDITVNNVTLNKDRKYYIEFLGSKKLCSVMIDKSHGELACIVDNYAIEGMTFSSNLMLGVHKMSPYDTTVDTFTDLIIYEEEIKCLDNKYLENDLTLQNSISLGRMGNIGTKSSAIGLNVVATGMASHAEGYGTRASGNFSHAEGNGAIASAEDSHAEGYDTIASSMYQHVQGKNNIEDNNDKYAHIVGNGEDLNNRSNAHTLDWEGNGWYAGKLSQEGTPTEDKDLATKKYVDDIKTDINNIKTDLGTEELTTTAKNVKGAVNEVAAQYKDIAKKTITNNESYLYVQKNLDLYPYTEQNGYLHVDVAKNTVEYLDETKFHSRTTNKIPCNPGDVFIYEGVGRAYSYSWVFFKNDLIVNAGQYQGMTEVTIPQDVNYVVFSSFIDIRSDIILNVTYSNHNTFNSKLNTKFNDITNTIRNTKVCDYPNLFDKTKVIKGYIFPSGALANSDGYYTSDYIFFEKGKTYTLSPKVRIIAYYNANKLFIKTDETAKTSPYTFTFEDDCYLRFSIYADTLNTFMVEEGETNTSYKPYAPILKNDVAFNTSHKEYINSIVKQSNGNVLFGKKLVACGDSFTEGDFTGYTDENGLSGKNSPVIYDTNRGMYKTYPWWIAERNNMTLVNEAKCGTTLTYIPEYTNAFSETRYKNLPKDADYILIKIGINDETGHKNAPLGTIDDTTNATFYGAWNVVLEYIITNHPWAKIGIIVTNGTSENYANAIKECAKKWGIPYLDEANGEQVPLLNRTNKSYVCKKAKDLRDAQMKVGGTNGHPNIKAHEYESTIVENFLKSL